MPKRLLLFVILLLFLSPLPVRAQQGSAVYIVQPGDTLFAIAERFSISLQAIMDANGITNPNFLQVGQRLILPGLEIQGTLTTISVPPGATFETLARQYHIDLPALRRVNRLLSPDQVYIGQNLIVVQEMVEQTPLRTFTLQSGESWFEAAVRQGVNPWSLSTFNGVPSPAAALPGRAFFAPTTQASQDSTLQVLPPAFLDASFEPLPPFQGDTVVIKVTIPPGYSVTGRLGDYELHFFPWKEQTWVALQGLHAMLEPGVYPLHLEARSGSDVQLLEQGVLIRDAGYPDDPIIYVKDQTTIDPAVMDAEWQQVLQLVTPVTPERFWDGPFQSPAALFPDPNCFTSRFGNRREYRVQNSNQAALYSFHSGVDFCGGSGLNIAAPAAGKVVFSGLLTVRGNATFIDHGWGVYSGYFHQAMTYVKPGDMVTPGQVIGVVGDTGRVTGAHLHWEIWVNGVQVNPLRWMEKSFP